MDDEIGERIKKKRELKKKKGEVCVYCNCNNKLLLTIDHKIPLSKGGEDVDSNKQVACAFCNFLKGNSLEKDFKLFLKNLYSLYDLGRIHAKINQFQLRFNPMGIPHEAKIINGGKQS